MESFGGVGILPGGCIVRKKRSTVSYKPRLYPKKYIFPPFGKLLGSPDQKQNNEEKVVLSDGRGSENKPKKFKLKLGGVTHTIHTKYKMKPLSQGDVDGSRLCSNEGKGFGVEQIKHSKINYSSRKDYSSQRKVLRQSAPRNNEQVKSKRVLRRCVLDAGFREYQPPRLGKESRKKSKSEKMYEDSNYSEEEDEEEDEEERISDDEPESHGKKLKRRSVTLLQEWQKESTPTTCNQSLQSGRDILSGSASGFVDLENNLLPAPSKRKKGKISEVEQQLKKVEATQRRKMQSQKAARKAEDDAIRKILGQGSRKKKEEKLKQQRDELKQGKTGSSVTLAPNSVRWVIGPNGTIVTFSDDIGLPDIFTPVAFSYPPSREKCAGPNCTNAYKYRDSKSKLPLCSLHCYRAIHEKMQPLFAC